MTAVRIESLSRGARFVEHAPESEARAGTVVRVSPGRVRVKLTRGVKEVSFGDGEERREFVAHLVTELDWSPATLVVPAEPER